MNRLWRDSFVEDANLTSNSNFIKVRLRRSS